MQAILMQRFKETALGPLTQQFSAFIKKNQLYQRRLPSLWIAYTQSFTIDQHVPPYPLDCCNP